MLPDTTSLEECGGAMQNYSALFDPTTDEDAKFRNIYVSDATAMTHTSPRAMRSFIGKTGATPIDPLSGFVHDAHWGNSPTVKPAVVRAGAGVWDITWPPIVTMPLYDAPVAAGGGAAAIKALNFRRAYAQVESADGTFKDAKAKVTSANTVRVYGYSGTTLDDLDGLVVTIWVY